MATMGVFSPISSTLLAYCNYAKPYINKQYKALKTLLPTLFC